MTRQSRTALQMKILCFIDSLGSGGAQRQLTTLAVALKKRGHDLRFLVYHPEDHFRPWLDVAGIECQTIAPLGYFRRMFEVRRVFAQKQPDVVLAFLEGPAFYAEIAALPRRKFGLVVGERLAEPALTRGKNYWLRHFHALADAVITNSYTNQLQLEHAFPGLRKKLATIYNAVDMERFHPPAVNDHAGTQGEPVRVVVAASYQAKKNMENVAQALLLLRNGKASCSVVVDWYGGPANDANPLEKAQHFVAEHDLSGCLRFHPAKRDIEVEFASAAAVGLFSFYEGLPNVVCEGMACQKPILMSDVCDAGSLVVDGENGFLCDPASPPSIAEAFRKLISAPQAQLRSMGLASRRKAEVLFAEATIVRCYEQVLEAAALHLPPPSNST